MALDQEGTENSWNIFNVAVVVAGSTALLLWKHSSVATTACKITETNNKPPQCDLSLKEWLGNFFSPRLPLWIAELLFDQMKCNVIQAPKIPLAPPFYVVGDGTTARRVLEATCSTKWAPANQFFIDTTNGMNFIAAEGHRWKHVRKSLGVCFHPNNLSKMVDRIQIITQEWMKDRLELEPSDKIDILQEMNRITSSVICDVAFDYPLSAAERAITLQNLETCWQEFGTNDGKNIWRQFRITAWMFPGKRKARAAARGMYQLCQTMLDQYRQKSTQHQLETQHKIIHTVLHDSDYENDQERIVDMVALVIAGFDTTANTLAFCFRELAQDINLQQQLRRELLNSSTNTGSIVSSTSTSGTYPPLLHNIVKETLRLYPAAAAGSVRVLGKDIPTTLTRTTNNDVPTSTTASEKTNATIPAGSLVLTSYYAIQRNPNVYPHANEFLPSRWDADSTVNQGLTPEQTKQQSMDVMTFSLGKRNCLGQALATAELYEVLAQIIMQYEFKVVELGQPENLVLFKPVGTILAATKIVE